MCDETLNNDVNETLNILKAKLLSIEFYFKRPIGPFESEHSSLLLGSLYSYTGFLWIKSKNQEKDP